MPKMKTRRAAAKRFTALKGGKVKRGVARRRHNFDNKSSNRMRHLRNPGRYVDETQVGEFKRLLPYGSP